MDGSTYGKSKMRHPIITKKSRTFKNKKERRKKKINNINFAIKKSILISIWQFFILNIISSTFCLLFISQGWSKINNKDIVIFGNSFLEKEYIINSMALNLPQTLISLNPKKIQSEVKERLPLKALSINRSFFPPRLEVKLLERSPIAMARRTRNNSPEEGMIDIDAYWIPMELIKKETSKPFSLKVEGWRESHRHVISRLLHHRDMISSPLEKIIINENGEVSLQTKTMKLINLGSNFKLLRKQIRIISHLEKELPQDLSNTQKTIIDLKNPSKPQLRISKS